MATTYTFIAANKRKSALLLVFFVAFILLLGWAIGQWTEAGSSLIVLALIISFVMAIVGYYRGDAIALWTAGAQPIAKEQNPYVYRMVENLCIAAGLPMPKIYLVPDDGMNAFATGRDPKHASLALTTGIVSKLENEELEGVIAHELSHIGNYDIRFMTLVAILVGLIVIVSDMFLRSMWFGGGRRRDDRNEGGNILAIIGLVFIILSPIIAQLIKLAISRRREYLADASGALLTRYPEGLANALEKIGRQSRIARASNATAHLYIENPFGEGRKGFATLFATHPPIEDRIRALRQMAGSMPQAHDETPPA